MSLQKHKLRQKGMLRPYGGTGNDPNDRYTVTQLSSAAALSSIGVPTSKLLVKKETFFIGGAEKEFVIDVSAVTA